MVVILALAAFLWAVIIAGLVAIGLGNEGIFRALITAGAWFVAVVFIGGVIFAVVAHLQARRNFIAEPLNRERLP